MDKNIYTLSNYMDNELESYEICKLNELELKKMKKSIKRSNKKSNGICPLRKTVGSAQRRSKEVLS